VSSRCKATAVILSLRMCSSSASVRTLAKPLLEVKLVFGTFASYQTDLIKSQRHEGSDKVGRLKE
jgi:hypothetical protein